MKDEVAEAAATAEESKAKAIEVSNAAILTAEKVIEVAAAQNDNVNKSTAETAKTNAGVALAEAEAINIVDADAKDKAKVASEKALTESNNAIAALNLIRAPYNTKKEAYLDLIKNNTLVVFNAMDAAIITSLKNIKGVDNTNFKTLTNTFILKIAPFFNSIFETKLKEGFLNIPLILPPSPSIAGVYAAVDRNRGVWKAPANVSLNSVKKPEVPLSDLDQEDFNVDAENGKSINCIRNFVGRGKSRLGARTLAGNNNEWRYINVRRFFNMVEESCENASRQFVFEPIMPTPGCV